MASLKLVTSVTVTSPWSDYTGADNITRNGSVMNPSYPIFAFTYAGGPGVEVGYVVGTNAYEPYASASGGANYLSQPALYLSVIGYNYAIGGGGLCGYSNCNQNGPDLCGYWMMFVDLTSNTVTLNCKQVPESTFGTHYQGAIMDLVNGNILLFFETANAICLLIWIIPFNGVSTFLSGTMPSNATWAYISTGNSNATTYTSPAIIWNGNLIVAPQSNSAPGGTAYLWYVPLSTLYSNAMSGTPSSSSSPVTVGTLYQINTNGQIYILTLVSVPSSSGITTYIAGEQHTSTTTAYVFTINPSNATIVNSITVTFPTASNMYTRATWNSLFLFPTSNGTTAYLTIVDPKVMTAETVSTSGVYAFASSEGYFVVSSAPLNSSSVTFNIYQVLADNTYVFQNISITQSGSTITATGTLINATTGNAVSGATVYLVGVNSLNDNYSNDVTIIASGTTNSNGQFTISGTASSSVKFYGVKYVP